MAQGPQVATYTNDPANCTLDRVRFLIGDTDCQVALLSDAEIELFIGEEASVLRAAAKCAEGIAAKLARRIDYSHGPVRKNASQAYEQYVALADDLHRRANVEGCVPEAMGLTVDEKETADEDTTRVQPNFKRGMHDNPRAGSEVVTDPNEPITY